MCVGREVERHHQRAVAVLARPRRARPAESEVAVLAAPDSVGQRERAHRFAPVPCAHVEHHSDLGRPVGRFDTPQDHAPVRIRWHGQRLPAFSHRFSGPPAPPDQAAVLVIPAPDLPRVGRGDAVPASTAKKLCGRRGAVPPRRHIQAIVLSGPTRAPRSPSAMNAYSRSTRGSTSSLTRVICPAVRRRNCHAVWSIWTWLG